MNKRMIWSKAHWLAGLAAAALVFGAPAAKAEPRRLALVIGNALYAQFPMLEACGGSANMMSAALKRAEFEVTLLANPSNGQMGAAITQFTNALADAPGSLAVAYVCGYAVAFDGRVFLLPATANLARDADVLTQGVVGRLLANMIARSTARAGLVLLDNMDLPDRDAALPMEGVIDPAGLRGKGFVAVQNRGPKRPAPTPLTAAVVAGLAGPAIDARALLRELRTALPASPQLAIVIHEPPDPAWLSGPLALPAPPPPPVVAPSVVTPSIVTPAIVTPSIVTPAIVAPAQPAAAETAAPVPTTVAPVPATAVASRPPIVATPGGSGQCNLYSVNSREAVHFG